MGRACRGIRRAPPRLHGPMGGRLARGSGWVHEAVAGRPVGRSSLTERRPASAVRRALRRHRSRRVGALPRGHFHCGVSPSGGPAGRSDDMYSGLTSMPSAVCLVSSAAGSLPPSSLVARFVQRAGRLHRLRAERKGRMRRRNPGRRGVLRLSAVPTSPVTSVASPASDGHRVHPAALCRGRGRLGG